MSPARKLPLKSGWGAKMVASIPNDARWLPYTAITEDFNLRFMHTWVSHGSPLTVPETLQKDFHHIGNARQTRSSGNQTAIRFFVKLALDLSVQNRYSQQHPINE